MKRGASLIEFTLAIGMGAASLASVGYLFIHLKRAEKHLKIQESALEIEVNVTRILSDRQACTNTLNASGPINPLSGQSFSEIRDSQNNVVYQVGQSYGGVTLTGVQTDNWRAIGTPPNITKGSLDLFLRLSGRVGSQDLPISREVSLMVNLRVTAMGPSNQVDQCWSSGRSLDSFWSYVTGGSSIFYDQGHANVGTVLADLDWSHFIVRNETGAARVRLSGSGAEEGNSVLQLGTETGDAGHLWRWAYKGTTTNADVRGDLLLSFRRNTGDMFRDFFHLNGGGANSGGNTVTKANIEALYGGDPSMYVGRTGAWGIGQRAHEPQADIHVWGGVHNAGTTKPRRGTMMISGDGDGSAYAELAWGRGAPQLPIYPDQTDLWRMAYLMDPPSVVAQAWDSARDRGDLAIGYHTGSGLRPDFVLDQSNPGQYARLGIGTFSPIDTLSIQSQDLSSGGSLGIAGGFSGVSPPDEILLNSQLVFGEYFLQNPPNPNPSDFPTGPTGAFSWQFDYYLRGLEGPTVLTDSFRIGAWIGFFGNQDPNRQFNGDGILNAAKSNAPIRAAPSLPHLPTVLIGGWKDTFSPPAPTVTSKDFQLLVNGASTSTGPILPNLSDIRLKKDIKPYERGLDDILKLQAIRFKYKDDPKAIHFGFSAQEMMKHIPEAVVIFEDGVYRINYDTLFWSTVNASQELKLFCEDVNQKLESLKSKIEERKSRLKELLAKRSGSTDLKKSSE